MMIEVQIPWDDVALTWLALTPAVRWEPSTDEEQLVARAHHAEWQRIRDVLGKDEPYTEHVVLPATSATLAALRRAAELVAALPAHEKTDNVRKGFEALNRTRAAVDETLRAADA